VPFGRTRFSDGGDGPARAWGQMARLCPLLASLGCPARPQAQDGRDTPAHTTPVAPVSTTPAKAPGPPPAPRPSANTRPAKAPSQAPARPAPPLSPEERALLEKDPKDLSPEDRRRRAHALRKQILQNPDSPAAQELARWRAMYEAGEIALPDDPKGAAMPHLSAPAKKPGP